MKYQPGLHILVEFNAGRVELLSSAEECKSLFDKLIAQQDLHNVGEIYHSFDNGGFTATVCLTESHLSIHTWPEYNLATFDIFLSNYQKDNTQKAKEIYQQVINFFEGIIVQKTELTR
jgi:S-adenosylmethionine decarboxylase